MGTRRRNLARILRNIFIVALLAVPAAVVARNIENTYANKHRDERRVANTDTVSIIASSAASTYTRFAEDIQNVVDALDPNGIRVLPILGRGGGQNFHDILFLRGVDAGTTDADYMHFYK